jgi:aminopeptidase N
MKTRFASLLLVLLTTSVIPLSFAQRLPRVAIPESYHITLAPDLQNETFRGEETIQIRVLDPSAAITLNSADIAIQEASIASGGKTQTASVALDPGKEMVILKVPAQLPQGAASIHLQFTGKLNNELRGFYLGHEGKRKYAATQFEATDARRAFPAFDEPEYKATFDITAIADRGDVAISNGQVISDTPGPGPNQHTVKFSTSPKMSSYLAALIVGDFKYIEGEQDGVPIRVWATPGKEKLGGFALEAAKHILSYYDNYFRTKYPYPKLDMVALPDFSAGAMENTACITYREVLLLIDAQHASLNAQQGVASVAAHEMAHQWFGDLVTMKWWDDIWLNEGFATWMSSKPVEAWKPEWHLELSDVRATGDALNLDSLSATRPIHQAADTPAQIQELFDGIAYGKTAAVLRMLESYVGEEGFRAGVNSYLQAHAYGNATATDFWTAMAQATRKPVDRIMPTFVNQAGAPIIKVETQCEGASTKVKLSQHRYFYDSALLQAPSQQIWQVPVCLKAGANAPSKCELLNTREASFTVPGCAPWVFGNAGAAGYYRSGYAPQTLQAMAENVEQSFTPGERVVMLRDEWAAVRSANASITDFMALASQYRAERNADVVHDMLQRLDYIGNYLVTESDRSSYQKFVRNLLQPLATELGFNPAAGDSDQRRDLRARVLRTLGYTGRDPQALAAAKALAQRELQDPNAVDPTLSETAFRLAAVEGDAAFYDKLRERLKAATSPEQYYLYLGALTQFSDPALLRRTLELALTPEIRNQDAFLVIAQVMQNPAGTKLAWDFSRSHWPEIQKIGGTFAGAFLVYTTSTFCDPAARDQVQEFFREHQVPEAERTLRQTLETINSCIDLKSRQAQNLAGWLQSHAGAAAGR